VAIGTPVEIGTFTTDGNFSPYTLTTTGTVPSGSRIFVVVNWIQNVTVGTITVSGGGLSWEQDHLQVEDQGGNQKACTFWSADCPSGLASSTNISIALTVGGAGNRWGIGAAAFHCSGIAAASRTDGSTDQIMGNLTAWDAEALTTTNANDLLLAAAVGDGVDTGGSSIDSPWVELADWFDSANQWAHILGYRIVSSTSTYGAGGDWPSSSDFGALAVLAAYKAAEDAGVMGGGGGMARPGRARDRAPRREGRWF